MKQCKKTDLWTSKGWPRQFDSETYWIDKQAQDIFFGEYNKTICDAFKNEPNTIERLLCFDKDLFFDDDNLVKLMKCNPNYKLSNRSLLWNSEKYNYWMEQRNEEVRQSRLDWKSKEDVQELKYRNSNDFDCELDDENIFNALTDGQLGEYRNFMGNFDDIDDLAGR